MPIFAASIWYPNSNNYAQLVDDTWGVQITSLPSAGLLETDANGRITTGTGVATSTLNAEWLRLDASNDANFDVGAGSLTLDRDSGTGAFVWASKTNNTVQTDNFGNFPATEFYLTDGTNRLMEFADLDLSSLSEGLTGNLWIFRGRTTEAISGIKMLRDSGSGFYYSVFTLNGTDGAFTLGSDVDDPWVAASGGNFSIFGDSSGNKAFFINSDNNYNINIGSNGLTTAPDLYMYDESGNVVVAFDGSTGDFGGTGNFVVGGSLLLGLSGGTPTIKMTGDDDLIQLAIGQATVNGDILLPSTGKFIAGDSGTYINQATDGHLDLTADISIDLNGNVYASGNVGIGTTTPAYPLDVYGDARIDDNLYIGDAEGDSNIYFYEDGSPTGEYIRWNNANDRFEISDYVYVDTLYSVGNITTGGSGQIVSNSDIVTTGVGDDLWLGNSTQANSNFQAYADGKLYALGNVGIGTTTPYQLFSVAGNAVITGTTTLMGTTTLNGVSYRWPTTDGTDGQVLKTNGAGQLSWQDDDIGLGASSNPVGTFGGGLLGGAIVAGLPYILKRKAKKLT